jgi:hypothetical protein
MSADHHTEVIKEVGIFGLKTLLTLNSGASIVLLAFVGNIYGQDSPTLALDLARLKCAMGLFLAGITSAMLSVTFTYILSQLNEAGNPRIGRMSVAGFLAWMIVPAVVSFLFFGAGFLMAICALE